MAWKCPNCGSTMLTVTITTEAKLTQSAEEENFETEVEGDHVWDGDSLDGLTGLYGAYALLNSPHKLSTYLAGGLPVIVAKNAAAADFVAREQVGVALNSLRELPELIRTMPEEDYQRYAANARRVGTRLRAGENTKRALRKLEEVE